MSNVEFATLADALRDLQREGFTETFEPLGDRLYSRGSGRVYAPNEMIIVKIYRTEGPTDPADMSVIYALEAIDGLRGTIIDAYGPYSSPTVGDALKSIKVAEPAREGGPPEKIANSGRR